ncbi:hypothetical protein ACHQM5_030305 [Ranunculus cassubicifolius]
MKIPATTNKDISVVSVYKDTFMEEDFCKGIVEKLRDQENPIIAFDTEFPGTIDRRYTPTATSEDSYEILKHNVDATNIIQLGLTLQTKGSNGEFNYDVWEFNFKDFNLLRGHHHNPESIKLLKQQGIDFEKNTRDGIDSRCFSTWLKLLLFVNKKTTWVGFHSAYDFGYMIKILTGKPLPEKLSRFKSLVKDYFGCQVYDLKYVIKDCRQPGPGLYGGLDKIAKAMNVNRAAGICHQAGSDSLLTMQTYNAVLGRFFSPAKSVGPEYGCKLFGLEKSHFGSTDGCKSGPGNQVPFVEFVK